MEQCSSKSNSHYSHDFLLLLLLIYRESYMSPDVLLHVLNELRKTIKTRALPRILSLFRNEFNIFNKT